MSEARTVKTFCRICPKFCGLTVQVVDNEVTDVSGDRDHPITKGFSCPKGRGLPAIHSRSGRFTTAHRRDVDGVLRPVDTQSAIDDIAHRLTDIIGRHGPDSVGLFLGTQAYQATPTIPFVKAWLRAVGTHKYFRTATIDQSAKSVAAGRLGMWMGGPQRFEDADVWLFAGINPLVSMFQMGGFPIHGGRAALKEARQRGTQILVVDPRRTETAASADVHLQLVPGTDALLSAALLNVVLTDGLHDAEFCAEHVKNLDRLRQAVADVTPEAIAEIVGVDAADIRDVASRFARAERGMAVTGTGANMGPWSNLNEHLIQALNAVCGRHARAGDVASGFQVLSPQLQPRGQAMSPTRPWDSGYRSRLGYGLIDGDLPTASLPREITEPGDDRLRALIVVGGNPASAIPDQRVAVDALSQLDLLVVLEPYATESAQLADYVIAPALLLERADNTRGYDDVYTEAFAMYTPPVLERPEGVIEDWAFFAELGTRMGLTLRLGSLAVAPGEPMPSTEQVLDHLCRHGRADLDDLRKHPSGRLYPDLQPPVVAEPEDGAGRLDVMPSDVARELASALRLERFAGPSAGSPDTALLTVRRALNVMNTFGRWASGYGDRNFKGYNPCQLHPDQLEQLGLTAGNVIELASTHGRIRAIVEPDPTVRLGTATMSHCWGNLPGLDDDPMAFGSNPGRLLSLVDGAEDINAMPQMTAIEVVITAVADSARGTA
ncbi:molybdopterin-dependent oxidoreductase [Mycobacterium syngnathidarum]